jgi:hypothetical protein
VTDEARVDRSVRNRRRLARAGFGLVVFLMLAAVAVGIVECARMPYDSGGDRVEGPSMGAPPDSDTTTVTSSTAEMVFVLCQAGQQQRRV